MLALKTARLSTDEFAAMRREVLSAWPTGQEVGSIDENAAYLAAVPEARRLPAALARARRDGVVLTQPRAGVPQVDEHIRLLGRLESEGQADLLPTTIDSYTRQNRYKEAAAGIEESRRRGRAALNGFPAVNHGVARCREVTSAVNRPVEVRHGTPDARLLAEISLAGGFTSFEGGAISYNIPYAKSVTLEQSIRWWRYVDRLVGFYAERGAAVNREQFGPLTGTLVPPSISNAVAIIEALLAAEQGVLDITVGYGQCGNLYQDIAAVRTLERLAREYLAAAGGQDVAVSTVFHQWMGGFPTDEAAASGVIAWGAAGAALSGATKVITKTPHEALGVPTAESNIQGLRLTRQVLQTLAGQAPLADPRIDAEAEMIAAETTALVDATIRLGGGDLGAGVARAFAAGVLDIPFAPSRMSHGSVLPARDLEGAVRILEFGALPFDDGIKSFHRRKLEERARAEGRMVSFQMVTDDIYAVSKGRLVGKPAARTRP